MKLYHIILIMLVVFFLEGTVFYWMIPDSMVGTIVPRFMLLFVVFSALYRDRRTATLLGFGFGLLHDLVYYEKLIGIQAFTMAGIGYLLGQVLERKRSDLLIAIIAVAVASILFDFSNFLLYRIFRLNDLPLAYAIGKYFFPNIVFQSVFAIISYVPLRKWFESSVTRRYEDDLD